MNLAQPCHDRSSADFQVCCIGGFPNPPTAGCRTPPPIWKSAIQQVWKPAVHGMEEFLSMKTNRRDFLKTAGAATLSALGAGYPRAVPAAEALEKIKPTADTLIVLWLAGGMAHTETFDPKHY